MTSEKKSLTRWLLPLLLLGAVIGVGARGYYAWQENKAMDEMVSPGLRLINYTDDDVYASVWNAKYPKPGQGAADGVGPHGGGGGVICCVPIPLRWRPGIKMIVWYSHKDWRPENGITKTVELPEYPGGEAGDLYLVFHSKTEFELLSSNFAPGHPRWPGKHVEPVIEGLE